MTRKDMLEGDWFNEEQAIQLLGLQSQGATLKQARERLRWLIRKHGLPVAKVGRFRMFSVESLRTYLESRVAQIG